MDIFSWTDFEMYRLPGIEAGLAVAKTACFCTMRIQN